MSQTSTGESGFSTDHQLGDLIVIAGLTAVLFAGGLFLAEAPGELGLDIDWKPFFVVYAVIIFVPWGLPTVAAALGATFAEAFLDVAEGAAADDPFGWVGYAVGFTAAGYIFGNDTSSTAKMAIGGTLGALLQYAIEGLFLFAIGSEPGSVLGMQVSGAAPIYGIAVIGNTITHGVILGFIPLIPTVGYLEGRIQRMFPLAAEDGREPAAD
ncbi:MAG: hypothetical protein ABEH77_05110 [Halobacteriaceae archaeon]